MHRMIARTGFAAALLAGGVIAVAAQQDAIKSRQSIMKDNGSHFKTAVQVARGDWPFDAAKAKAAFETFADAGRKMPDLFPENSKTGRTDASPKIWQNMNDVKAKFAKLERDATAAAQAQAKDLASFRTAPRTVERDCGDCHEVYRIRRR